MLQFDNLEGGITVSNVSELYTEFKDAGRELDHAIQTDPIRVLTDALFKGKGPAVKFDNAEHNLRNALSESAAGASETPKPTTHPSSTWAEYWNLCSAVVDAASKVAAKDKLLMNFRDPKNSHKVKPIINKHFHGDVKNLKDARADCIRAFFAAVDEVNWYARKHDLAQASAMKLMGQLESANDRKRFRYFIKKHLEENHPPFELDELVDRDFRTSPRK